MGSPDEYYILLRGKGDEKWPGLIIEAESTQDLFLPEIAEHVVSDFHDYLFWFNLHLANLRVTW